jgi:hypothetical protein
VVELDFGKRGPPKGTTPARVEVRMLGPDDHARDR